MIVSSLFVLCQNYFGFLEFHCFVSAGPILVDVSHSEDFCECIIWKISSITLMHSNWCCVWLICANFIISSCNLVLLLKLLYIWQRHVSDQVYKLHQCNFILCYVIVQRVKISVAILTDLNLLPHQTAIMQWRNFNKDIFKIISQYSYWKLNTTMISIKHHFHQKVSI